MRTANEYETHSVVLVLGSTALALEGRVLDSHGGALVGWVVSIVDGTEVADPHAPRAFVEELAVGRRTPVTDAGGRFRLTELFPRAYELIAYDAKSLQSVRGGPFEAGRQDVVLNAELDSIYPRIAGRILSRRGSPVALAKVSLGFVTNEAHGGRRQWIQGASTTTDEDGRFALTSVPRVGVHLDVTGDHVMPESFGLDAVRDAEAVGLSVALRCHFRVTLDRSVSTPVWIEIVDGTGALLEIYAFDANVWSSTQRQPIEEQGSGILAVSEDARTLRVLDRGETGAAVLAEVPLVLDPGEVTVIPVER